MKVGDKITIEYSEGEISKCIITEDDLMIFGANKQGSGFEFSSLKGISCIRTYKHPTGAHSYKTDMIIDFLDLDESDNEDLEFRGTALITGDLRVKLPNGAIVKITGESIKNISLWQ